MVGIPSSPEAAQIVLVGDAQKVLKDQDVTGAESVVTRINALLEKDPDDGAIAQFAMQFAGALEHMPEGSEAAGKAYAAFGGAFVKSSNPQIKAMGEGMAGMLRRLGLIGNEMEIRGTNLDGQAFDQKTLDGKVVLVDFWATSASTRTVMPSRRSSRRRRSPGRSSSSSPRDRGGSIPSPRTTASPASPP